jgi:hypothetical protein
MDFTRENIATVSQVLDQAYNLERVLGKDWQSLTVAERALLTAEVLDFAKWHDLNPFLAVDHWYKFHLQNVELHNRLPQLIRQADVVREKASRLP